MYHKIIYLTNFMKLEIDNLQNIFNNEEKTNIEKFDCKNI